MSLEDVNIQQSNPIVFFLHKMVLYEYIKSLGNDIHNLFNNMHA